MRGLAQGNSQCKTGKKNRAVWALLKKCVEKVEIRTATQNAGIQYFKREPTDSALFCELAVVVDIRARTG